MLTQTLTVAAILVVIAMTVAVLIKVMVVLFGRSAARAEQRRAAAVADSSDVSGASGAVVASGAAGGAAEGRFAPGATDGVPPLHVAIIAAAVSSVFDDAVVVRIGAGPDESAWASQGRAEHHHSHSVRGSQ